MRRSKREREVLLPPPDPNDRREISDAPVTAVPATAVSRAVAVDTVERVETVGEPYRAHSLSQAGCVLAGLFYLVIGCIAVAKGGLGGRIDSPVVSVIGVDHTPLLGLIEIGVGAVALLVGVWPAARALVAFVGFVILGGGVALVARPSDLTPHLGAGTGFGWVAVGIGAAIVLLAVFVPDVVRRPVEATRWETVERAPRSLRRVS